MGVPLCPAWPSLFMRRGETDGQTSFNHHNEGIPMSEQTTHATNDTVDPLIRSSSAPSPDISVLPRRNEDGIALWMPVYRGVES